jgi:hypothetical protein
MGGFNGFFAPASRHTARCRAFPLIAIANNAENRMNGTARAIISQGIHRISSGPSDGRSMKP